MREKAQHLVQSKNFRRVFTGLGLLFVVLTYFISVSPQSFLKFGYPGIFVFNIVSSGLLILPIVTQKFNIFGVILASALGNIPNTSVNYLLGYSSNSMFSGNKLVNKLKELMKRFGLFAVYVLAIVPLPLDVNGLLSGYLGISYKRYILVNFLGKLTIFALTAFGVLSLIHLQKK